MDAKELRKLRTIPLEVVDDHFGVNREPRKVSPDLTIDTSRITFDGPLFFDHLQQVGGRGAIELTLYLMGSDIKRPTGNAMREAVRWLSAINQSPTPQPPTSAPVSSAVPGVGATAPEPDRNRIGRLYWYLTQQRSLPADLVDHVITRGMVFTDRRARAIFRLRDETGREVGYEKHGTYDRPFHAVQGEQGLFMVGNPSSLRAAFVGSALEALSYKALAGGVLAISTTGDSIELPVRMGRLLRERGFSLYTAFSADAQGDRFAERLSNRLGGEVHRDRPKNAKDWSETLKLRVRQTEKVPASLTPVHSIAEIPAKNHELTR